MESETVAEDVMRQPSKARRESARRGVDPRPHEHGTEEPEVDLLGSDLIGRDFDVGDTNGLPLDLFEGVIPLP